MNFSFVSDVKPKDFWLLTMTQTYKAWTGIVNIVFTIAMIGLTLRFYSNEHPIRNGLLLLGCSVFIIIQPMMMYLFACKQLESIPKDMSLNFDNSGIHVNTMSERENIPWKKVNRIIKAKNMIILYTSGKSGYMITNRMLDGSRDEFYDFCVEHMKKAQK